MLRHITWLMVLWETAFCSFSGPAAALSDRDIVSPVMAPHGMAVAGEPLAAQAGREVLRKGGNAVDAAVTMGFIMAVTLPQAGNIGGGGFMLLYSAKTGRVTAIDYRERAPAAASRGMFLTEQGTVDTEKSRFSHLSAGVPGTVAGLGLALERYGTLSLREALAPAIKLADRGFKVGVPLSTAIRDHSQRLKTWPSTRKIFFKPDGSAYEPGDLLVQKDLAESLSAIARNGVMAFYGGRTARLIVREMKDHGGVITEGDLERYRPVIRKPVEGTYRGYALYSMPPPSSGGVHVIQILNILEGYDLRSSGPNSAETIHLMAEAMKRAYADRSRYLGDPDFTAAPVRGLTSKAYAADLRKQIKPFTATPAEKVSPGTPFTYESEETTHFSVVDKEGNAVSNTYTINFSFGSGIVVEGAGFLLNNEMDDFSAGPGAPNAYGLIGGAANAIAPDKRMLSSMAPTILLKDGRLFMVTGSPGGAGIITTTLQVIVNVIDHGMNLQEAVNAPRIHHQWRPDVIRVEEGISPDTLKILRKMGYQVTVSDTMGAASSILIHGGSGALSGASDPRRDGMAAGY